MATTTNRGNPYPTDSDGVDVPGDIQALAEALDNAPLYDQGPYSSMGAATRGKLFRSSEDGLLHVSDGSTWGAVGKVPVVTGLPGSPADGQEVLYVANSTTREKWHLRYDSGKSGSYKWEALSAVALENEVADGVGVTATTYAGSGSIGPSVTLPLAGVYDVMLGASMYVNAPDALAGYMSFRVASGTPLDADALRVENIGFSTINVPEPWAQVQGARTMRRTLASGVLSVQYRVGFDETYPGTLYVANRSLRALPLWVG